MKRENNGTPKGTRLRNPFKLHKLNDSVKAELSKRVNEALRNRWKAINKIYNIERGKPETLDKRRDMLTNILKNTITRVASELIGTHKEKSDHNSQWLWTREVKEFIDRVGRHLKRDGPQGAGKENDHSEAKDPSSALRYLY